MQTMWTYCLSPQGEVGARGPPGAPGNVSKISPASSVHVNILYSLSQPLYDKTMMEEMDPLMLLHSDKGK